MEIKSENALKHFFNLMYFTHKMLFEKILTNAGEFRNEKDVNLGKVYFGGSRQRDIRFKFEGAPPKDIPEKVANSLLYLKLKTDNPVELAMHFYQEFVLCHPYYDANGRIARFMVNVFLNYYEMIVDWEHLHDNRSFIKHLNNCHTRFQKPKEYTEYFGYLVNVFKKHVINKNDFQNSINTPK
jgi:fido (protein-threonine AMPylation protein)